jgi:hypothetical protein
MDTQVGSSLLLLSTGTNKRDGTRSELGGVRTGHSAQPLEQAAS